MSQQPESPLFSPTLISPEIGATLPQGFTIRPIQRQDFQKGYLDCLEVLTWVGPLTEAEWDERYTEMERAAATYYLLVIEYQDRIVGTGSLVVERKFIHNRGLVGHVEEIAIAKEHQGKGLGLKMIQAIDSVGKSVGCYKNILNCGPQNEPFYAKCGYDNSGTEMSHYFETAKDNFHRG
ncbi:acyl-CoA N-acyltransferase [Cryphonectria parasitica EP155]|uniref:Glucosamine 6-phosphate N-acetyltransferase n=1 Tax=Cryphonectria parasitica (strain ATCC 38755 / EP155) TaxID=660469 RepID=A0A9P4Y277_CRYP1|nr:acyl-CoA N-acyltransferase [Cryphonectria parasitica EP155]KAF3765191.1 acyl-CoA N-acyltransferase [Cryphonectria parasitica EP155]